MLKKPAAISLLLLYISTASGFGLNLHYCFNRLTAVQIDAPVKTCAPGIAAGRMSCCHDKHIDVKVKDAHQPGGSVLSKIFNEELPLILFGNMLLHPPVNLTATVSYHAPPGVLRPAPIFLANCTFRI
jgi:hypothetical protein